MRLSFSRLSSTSMKFVTPSQYTKSNMAHFIINTKAANDFSRVHPRLGDQDRVLDFGCGTGETTLAIAQGQLGDLGSPDQVAGAGELYKYDISIQVVGVDISDDMIAHCHQHHQPKTPNMTFQQLDSSQGASFISTNKASFSLVTSFSCLHWVPDMPSTVSLFNKVLKSGGQFLFVVMTLFFTGIFPTRLS